MNTIANLIRIQKMEPLDDVAITAKQRLLDQAVIAAKICIFEQYAVCPKSNDSAECT